MRRPPGNGVSQRKLFLAGLAILFSPALRLAIAQQQQQQPAPAVASAPPSLLALTIGHSANSHETALRKALTSHVSPAEAESFREQQQQHQEVDDPRHYTLTSNGHSIRYTAAESAGSSAHSRPRGSNSESIIASACKQTTAATVAPDLSVRAPSPALRDAAAVPGSGLSSPHIARSLEDWEVEDFVLLVAVDGGLYAVSRKTGKVLWHDEDVHPVVTTIHHRANTTPDDELFSPFDQWTWAVEPSGNGTIFLVIPGSPGIADTGLTMKWIVEHMPYYDRDHPLVFTGSKATTMVSIDATNGRVRKLYASPGADDYIADDADNDQPASCIRPNNFNGGRSASRECTFGGTITMGRSDYTVVVRRRDGPVIATLRYSEWAPNNFDQDLHQQYRIPSDNRYITSKPNGDVYGFTFDPSAGDGIKPTFSNRFDAPIIHVFDVARPHSVPLSSNPELALLPQPPPPAEDEVAVELRRTSIFVNQTEAGGWYAMSGSAFPLVIDASLAECAKQDWWDRHDDVTSADIQAALPGKHSLMGGRQKERAKSFFYPTLPGGEEVTRGGFLSQKGSGDAEATVPLTLPQSPAEPSPYVITKVRELPQVAANRVLDFLSNPVLFVLAVFLVFYYQKDVRRWYNGRKKSWVGWMAKALYKDLDDVSDQSVSDISVAAADLENESAGILEKPSVDGSVTETPRPARSIPLIGQPEGTEGELDGTVVTDAARKDLAPTTPMTDDGAQPPEKKKAHRGRRGGTKHRKGSNKGPRVETSQSRGDEALLPTVDEVVVQAKQLGENRLLEPDIVTVSNDMQEVSGPILRMGSLEVNEDQQLGTGSNGTVVFAGTFDGRAVAVKRMLVQFYDIASQETKLLRESDDHPNVIRYFAQQQRAGFHYIALELCQASLGEVIEKPHLFRDLAKAGERDLPNVLYQIACGLNHLHSRSIVHRDLKPQNILVNMGPDDKPRILISDFGLCKKLEGGQSSFGATTAHAAGTNGWRAPELLLDDDARDSGQALMEAASSTHSGSVATAGTADGTRLPSRRVTKAIDVFGLGLVFFYVLTKGSHPFDCGDKYMREVNIRKGVYRLDALDVLGDYAWEAKDLVGQTVDANPRRRPKTREVLAHPFFWPAKKRLAFLCDVSDHFEKEPRDPPSAALEHLEAMAPEVLHQYDFLKRLPKEFVDSLGKQRKYNGMRLLDLLRALRNKRNHYEDMSEPLRRMVGPLPEGYLGFWTVRFPSLLIQCWRLGLKEGWEETDRFADYYVPTAGV